MKKTIRKWKYDDMEMSVVEVDVYPGHLPSHYCGYVKFEEKPVKEESYWGIICYIPVHGGITYAEEEDDGSFVYGFDCAHGGDSQDPRTKDLEWLGIQTHNMAVGIKLIAKYEDEFNAYGEFSKERDELMSIFYQELRTLVKEPNYN